MKTSRINIDITEKAKKKIKELSKLQQKTKDDDKINIRIKIEPGGCAGLVYTIDFNPNSKISELKIIKECKEFCLLCDNKSLLYLDECSLDYEFSNHNEKFKLNLPNKTKSCECGQSFKL